MKEKSIVIRERNSLRDVVIAIHIFIKRRTAIWNWLQKFGNILEKHVADKMPDETLLQNTAEKYLS